MNRGHELLVTGKRKKTDTTKNHVSGTFHQLPEKLQDLLIAACKRGSACAWKDFQGSIDRQREGRAEKMKMIEEKSFKPLRNH